MTNPKFTLVTEAIGLDNQGLVVGDSAWRRFLLNAVYRDATLGEQPAGTPS
jgi:hypothetical protein